MSTEKNTDQFSGWDENVPEIDFFGESTESTTEAAEVVESIKEDKLEEGKEGEEGKEKEPEKKEPEIDFFGTNDDGEEKGSEDEGEEDEKKPASKEEGADEGEEGVVDTPVATVNFLKEKGLIEFELEEGVEMTPELAEEILEDSFDDRVESRMEELFGELPDVVKNLNKFAMQGGDIKQFLGTLSKSNESGITADIDLTKESNQELVIKNQLKAEGYDDDYISSQLEFLKDSNKLEKIAQTHFDKWKVGNEKEQERVLKAQQERVKAEKENRRKLKSKVSSLLDEAEDLQGIKLSKQDKKILPSYMTDRNVKLENGSVITGMQKDLYAALQDDNKAVLLAKLLKSDFDFKDIAVTAETKVAKKVKENIRRNKTNTPSKSATRSSQTQKKTLADFF